MRGILAKDMESDLSLVQGMELWKAKGMIWIIVSTEYLGEEL